MSRVRWFAALWIGIVGCGGQPFESPGDAGITGGTGGSSGASGHGGGEAGAGGVAGGGGAAASADASADADGAACNPAKVSSDPANCGACGHSCLGTECIAGRCSPQVIATGVAPIGIAVQGGKLYLTDEGDATVKVMAKDGSGKPTVVASDQEVPGYVAVASNAIFWTLRSDGRLMKLAAGGAAPTAVLQGLQTPLGLASSGDLLFLGEAATGAVRRLTSEGTASQEIASLDADAFVEGIATDGQRVWVAMNGADRIVEVPVSGGEATPFVVGQGNPAGVAVDDEWVYWSNQTSGELRKKARVGADVVVTLAEGLQWPTGVAVDDQFVYCAEMQGQRIVRVAR